MVFLIDSPRNVFYLTQYPGFLGEEKDAKILLFKNKKYLFTDKRYLEEVKHLKNFKILENKYFLEILKKERVKELVFEDFSLSFSEYKKFKKVFGNLKPSSSPVLKLREIKNANEIRNIRKACKIGDITFNYLLKNIRKGVTEEELASMIEIFILGQNAKISFKPIVAFGNNSAIPHHQNSKRRLRKEEIILLDFGVNYKGYCSDMTRTLFYGKRNKKFEDIYLTVLRAQKTATEKINKEYLAAKGKLKASAVDKSAREFIVKKDFDSIPHSLGHGIGIEVHEAPSISPTSKDLLKLGMVFSIEPGIYINGWGGIRIEDLFFLTAKGLKKLTHSPNKIYYL